jgi:PUA-domain protein
LGRFLRKDDIRDMRARINEKLRLGDSLLPHGCKVEGFPIRKGEVFIVNDQPSFYMEENGIIFPLLVSVLKPHLQLPRIVVDMKAVPHVCNGADIFRGGVRDIDPTIEQGELIVVSDENNLKPICIGKALVDAKTMLEMTQGKVAINLHYVGDSVWDFSKSLEKRVSPSD